MSLCQSRWITNPAPAAACHRRVWQPPKTSNGISNAAFENGGRDGWLRATACKAARDARPDVCKQMAMKPITKYLNANLLYDEDATEEARDKAENDVTPVVYKKDRSS
ncbi:MAG: hypothetical protein ACLUVV_07045 [Christensenellales bacterium]